MAQPTYKDELPGHLLPFIWHFLRAHPISISGYLIIIFIASLEISLSPYLLKLMIDTTEKFSNNKTLFLSAIAFPSIFYIILTLIHNGAMRCYHFICFKLFPRLRSEISVAMFSHLSNHSISFFQRNYSGDPSNKVINIAEGVESIIKIFNQQVLGNFFTLVIGLILLTTVHIFFTAALLFMIILYILNGYLFSKKTALIAHDFSKANSLLSGQLVDSIANIVSAKVFSNIPFETTRVKEAVDVVGEQDASLQKQIMLTDFVQNIIFTILITLLISGLIYGKINNWITVGDFAFILGLSITIYSMVNGLTRSMPDLSREIGKCQQALNVIIVPHEIRDVENAIPLKVSNGEIHFKNITFHHDKNQLFENLNLKIPPKQKVGLVGHSGAGKTTLINLLFRLFEVQAGEILIDDMNIRLVTQESLNQNIALIPQHPELFNRSIMDNIRYGNTRASNEEVLQVSKLAKCHEFIMRIPDGYNSIVGERGIKLSGGQRQRIAIARTLLKNAPILVLDEATSALDSATETEIQEAMQVVMKNKTVLVIAHRLSTIMSMDRILVLDFGKIIEDGSVQELVAQKGRFAQLLDLQRKQ